MRSVALKRACTSRGGQTVPRRFAHVEAQRSNQWPKGQGPEYLKLADFEPSHSEREGWRILGKHVEVQQTQSGDAAQRDIGARPRAIPNRWLREQCSCKTCVNPATKQSNVNVFDGSVSTTIRDIRQSVPSSVSTSGPRSWTVTWKDGHQSVYNEKTLLAFFDPLTHLDDSYSGTEIHGWQTRSVQRNLPQVEYEEIMASAKGIGKLMREIKAMGFCFVSECPLEPDKSKVLLERIGPIRHTHYGGFYDFTSDLALKDTAYTSEALDLHTDTTYFNDPAGLEMFHLLSHTEGSGGATQLVDGYAAAHELKSRAENAYGLLANTKVVHHASGNEGILIQSHPHPILQNAEDSDQIQLIRWNNSDRMNCHMTQSSKASFVVQLDQWYKAAKMWNDIIHEKNEAWRCDFQLEPGRALIFDNWRILHGRSAFTGKRRMCGGYINRDDWISRYRVTNRGSDAVRS